MESTRSSGTVSPIEPDPPHDLIAPVQATPQAIASDSEMQSPAPSPPEVLIPPANNDIDSEITLSEPALDSSPVVADKIPQYDCDPEVHFAEISQQHQLPQAVWDHENFPQVVYADQPEALTTDGTNRELVKPGKQKTILGLRRRVFWAAVATALLAIIVATVVGGVLGSRTTTTAKQLALFPTTALAAVDYKEANGVEHRRVYFQAESNALFQSAWDSNSRIWETSPLNPHKVAEPEVKPGTPLAAYVFNDEAHSTFEFHVFFLDSQNKLWERGSSKDDMWGPQVGQVITGNYTAHGDSKIAAYAKACDDWCPTTSVVVWQNVNEGLSFAGFVSNFGWYQNEVDVQRDRPFLLGSSLSFSPIWGPPGERGLALYGNDGNLAKLFFNDSAKWEEGWNYTGSFPGNISSDAMFASFSPGINGKNTSYSDIEILAAEPGVAGSNMSWWTDSDYSAEGSMHRGPVSALSSDSNFSSITTSASGRVYAIDENTLVEWEWQRSTNTFKRIGTVNTTIGE